MKPWVSYLIGLALLSSIGSQAQSVWTAQSSSTTNSFNTVVAGTNGAYVALGDNGVRSFSSNGVSWNPGATGFSSNFLGSAYNAGFFYGVGPTNLCIRSSNGVSWSTNALNAAYTNSTLNAATFSGGNLVAVGNSQAITNGADQTILTNSLNAVVNGSQLIAVGENGVVATSSDRVIWKYITNVPTASLNGLVYAGTNYVAVGSGGAIYTSTDATNWTEQASGVVNDLKAIAYGRSRYVAVGSQGSILVSSNAVDWVDRHVANSAVNFTAVAQNGTNFVAVGKSGAIYSSVPPTVAISSPTTNSTITAPASIVVKGTASSAAQVLCRLGTNGGFQLATGTNTWSCTLTNPVPATNIIQVKAVNQFNDESDIASRPFFYSVSTNLMASIIGQGKGTITSGYVTNSSRIIGKSYSVTATPDAYSKFGAWYVIHADGTTNSPPVTSTNLSFVMEPQLTIQAKFDPQPLVKVTSPTEGYRFPISSNVITFKGSVTSPYADVQNVQCWIGGSTNTAALAGSHGTNTWSCVFTNIDSGITNYVAGPNTFHVKAFTTNNFPSLVTDAHFTYVVDTNLFVGTTLSGTNSVLGGTLTGGWTNNAVREIGKSYTVTATAKSGYIFQSWDVVNHNSTNMVKTAALTFTMQDQTQIYAHFIPNPFIPRVGTYQAVVYPSFFPNPLNGIGQPEFLGFAQITLSSTGSYSMSLTLAGQASSISGAFDGFGDSSGVIPVSIGNILLKNHLDISTNFDTLTGSILDQTGTYAVASFNAERSTYNSSTNPAPQIGSYTLLIPSDLNNYFHEHGQGYGTVKVDGSGNVTFAGVAGDGTALSQSSRIWTNGHWPVYVKLYNSKGYLAGDTFFNDIANGNNATNRDDLQGNLWWLKPSNAASVYFKNGFFDVNIGMYGSHYTAPVSTNTFIPITNQTGNIDFILYKGNLTNAWVRSATMMPTNKVVFIDLSNSPTVTLASSSGLFTGSFVHPVTQQLTSWKGAFLQKQGIGGGFFLGTNEVGSIDVTRHYERATITASITNTANSNNDYYPMEVVFYPTNAPLSVLNFKKLARRGYYDGTYIFRIVPGFAIQGDISQFGINGIGYTVPAEIGLSNVDGALAYARLPNTNNPTKASSGNQFFIDDGDQPFLDDPTNQYTVFGQVLMPNTNIHFIATQPTQTNPFTGANEMPVTPIQTRVHLHEP